MTTFVASGGALRGILHAGAYKSIIDSGIKVDEVYGTSAGAIIASAIAVGMEPSELELLICKVDFADLVSNSLIEKLYNVFFKSGLVRGDKLLKFAKDKICGKTRFGDIDDIKLNILTHSLVHGRWRLLNRDTAPNMMIKDAIRASTAIPVLFSPYRHHIQNQKTGRWREEVFVDGGVSKNFPVDLVEHGDYIGHWVSDIKTHIPKKASLKNIAMISFTQLLDGNCKESIADRNKDGLIVKTSYSKSMTDFSVTAQEREDMLFLGKNQMKEAIKSWLYEKKMKKQDKREKENVSSEIEFSGNQDIEIEQD